MSQPPTRDIIKIIFTNFINSLRPRQIRGNLMGKDYMGTKYFEIPPNASIGKRKAERWFEPLDKENFEQPIPAEWEGWLRGRRKNPPTEEDIQKSLDIIKMKKENAAKLEEKYAVESDVAEVKKEERGMQSFPQYGDEYEVMPGQLKNRRR